MTFFKRLPKSLIFLWLIQISIIGVLWDFLPSSLTGNMLLALAAVNGVLLYLRQLELPTFSTVALLLVLVHFWLGNGYTSPLIASLVVFAGSALIGLISAGATGTIGHDEILVWSLVGLFTSQVVTLTQLWPISYFQKSMLGTIVFYLVWQSWRVLDQTTGEGRRPILWHFIFVGLAVMVVVANIIWTTWPGLKTF
ncbi:MAG: hypothetical protein NUV80_00440 [Candidatus Berkelbacteria bacterium]|nr:hypothetical protein [Candidatus Berkelbacteria bacterium]MCR4307015.1 hypothetical protein [Candidatus Berkelbacteria bacterium]